MTEQLISFETVKLAKEKGFDNKVYGRYINQNRWYFNSGEEVYWNYDGVLDSEDHFEEVTNVLIPRSTQSLLQAWLRKEHEIHIVVSISLLENSIVFHYGTYTKDMLDINIYREVKHFKTYEEALEVALVESLKLI